MRTALIVAITLTFTIDARAQTRADQSHCADLYRPRQVRVGTQARCEAHFATY